MDAETGLKAAEDRRKTLARGLDANESRAGAQNALAVCHAAE